MLGIQVRNLSLYKNVDLTIDHTTKIDLGLLNDAQANSQAYGLLDAAGDLVSDSRLREKIQKLQHELEDFISNS